MCTTLYILSCKEISQIALSKLNRIINSDNFGVTTGFTISEPVVISF